MSETRTVTVRLPEPLHRAVKVRCAERGDSLEGVARAAFAAYLERPADDPGSPLEKHGVALAAGGEGRVVAESLADDGRAQKSSESHSRTPAEQSPPAASAGRVVRPDPRRK